MTEIIINKEHHFSVEANTVNKKITVDANIFDGDIVEVKPNLFHIIQDSLCYNVEIIKANADNTLVTMKINGIVFEAEIKDFYASFLKKYNIFIPATKHSANLVSPMYGLLGKILVEKGQKVEKGDPLVVIEAMKMENVIKAEETKRVQEIKIKAGENVEKNQVLIIFETENTL
ncbi:MAG: hypothetical protein QM536_07995 [Chitinophagaceae bacterium]|nr:hypothetical protein [Chitinophagaceae bacterium]